MTAPSHDVPPELLALRAADEELPFAHLEGMQRDLLTSIKADRGPAARLRGWPTWFRRALLMALGLVAMTLGALGTGSSWLALGVGVAALASLWLSLRPLHQPEPPPWVRWGAPLGALVVMGIVAALGAGAPAVGFEVHLRCAGPGIGISLLVLGVWRLLSRRTLGFYGMAAAAGAGLAANAFLTGRCAASHPMHVLAGHASVLAALLLGAWIIDGLRSR